MIKMRIREAVMAAALMMLSSAQAQENSLALEKDGKLVEYNPMIFGQFIEHFDNQVYGGIFDPGNPLSDEDGFRTDVIEAIKELKTPIVRWPGGCFVSTYHWLDGVGNNRQPVYDKTWQAEDPNTFGTDEYVKWCRKIGCEPYICTNAGTGTPEEMSDWVEYCNLNVGKWGKLRAQNGHPEPYNVKYWSVGNENWGRHELGARTVAEWGPLVRESAKLMRSVTKDIKLFAAATSDPNWSLPLLKEAGWTLDYISIHGYWDHEFYGYYDLSSIPEGYCKEIRHNVHAYYNGIVHIGEIDVIVSALWSKIDPHNAFLTERNVSDFYRIMYGKHRLTTDDFNREHERCLAFIKRAVTESTAKTKIVLTHHVPTQLCTAEEFRNSTINGAFTVELGDYIADSGVDFWIYGHSHRNIKTQIGKTRIVSNQLGYVSHREHLSNGFDFSAMIEV